MASISTKIFGVVDISYVEEATSLRYHIECMDAVNNGSMIKINFPEIKIIYLYKNASIDRLFSVYICQSLEIII